MQSSSEQFGYGQAVHYQMEHQSMIHSVIGIYAYIYIKIPWIKALGPPLPPFPPTPRNGPLLGPAAGWVVGQAAPEAT